MANGESITPGYGVLDERTKDIDKRIDRHEQSQATEIGRIWDELGRIWKKIDRLPNWAVAIISIMTGLLGYMAHYIH